MQQGRANGARNASRNIVNTPKTEDVAPLPSVKGRCAFFFSDPDDYVNIRRGPSTSTAIVTRYVFGKVPYIYLSPSNDPNWYLVSRSIEGPVEGYMYWNRAMLDGELAESKCGCVVTDPDGYTNVRLHATTESRIVKTLPKGHHFVGLPADDAPGWMAVLEPAKNTVNITENYRVIGFVHTSRIRITEPGS